MAKQFKELEKPTKERRENLEKYFEQVRQDIARKLGIPYRQLFGGPGDG